MNGVRELALKIVELLPEVLCLSHLAISGRDRVFNALRNLLQVTVHERNGIGGFLVKQLLDKIYDDKTVVFFD